LSHYIYDGIFSAYIDSIWNNNRTYSRW